MSTKIGILFAVVLFAANPLLTVSIAAGQTIDFNGKTVHLVLNAAADTPADLRQRAWAPYLQKQLPGNPKFVVTNRPRGRGTIAVRFISRVAPDGLTIGGLAGVTSAWAVGDEMPIPIDTFLAIGALRANRILVTGPQAPARTIEEIVRAKRRIILGVEKAAAANAILVQMFMDIAGIPYSFRRGYAGPQKSMPGLVGGKIHIASMDPEFFLPNRAAWARDLNIRGLLQTGNHDVGGPRNVPRQGQGQGQGPRIPIRSRGPACTQCWHVGASRRVAGSSRIAVDADAVCLASRHTIGPGRGMVAFHSERLPGCGLFEATAAQKIWPRRFHFRRRRPKTAGAIIHHPEARGIPPNLPPLS